MKEFLEKLFSSDFMPHGYCYLWKPGLVWLHIAFGRPYRTSLFFHSGDLGLFHTQEARPTLPLDVCQFWNVHPSLWYHTHHGSLDTLAWDLLALWGDQSCHCHGLGPYGDTACSISSPDAGTSEPGSHEARNCRTQTRRGGTTPSE